MVWQSRPAEVLDSLTIKVDMMQESPIYNHDQLNSSDPYNIFLSGAKKGHVLIENPNVNNGKKLIVFRDSFGSSIAPLFVQDYQTIILVDLRVMSCMSLRMVDFQDADVLFMLSALVLNNLSEAFI